MERIFSFSDFSALYEGEFYESDLQKIIADMIGLYVRMTGYVMPVDSYTDQMIDSDFKSITDKPLLSDKIEAFKSIMNKVKQKSLETNKITGAKELIEATDLAYNKCLEALESLKEKYKDDKGLIDFLNTTITKANQDLDAEVKKNESYRSFDPYVDFQIFEGKKSLFSDIENGISNIGTKIAGYAQDIDQKKKSAASSASLKLNEIRNSFDLLKNKKNRDLKKEDTIDLLKKITELEKNFNDEIDKIDKDNQDALKLEADQKEIATKLKVIRTEAGDLMDLIVPLNDKYLLNKSSSEGSKLGVEIIKYDSEKGNVPNSEVKKFQELATDKFKNVKSISDLPAFKNMGTSGRFGPATAAVVKGLKKGYKLSDTSTDITPEFFAKLNKEEVIKESRILSFSGFSGINEEFDVQAAVETIKSDYKPRKTSSRGDEKSPYGWKPASYKEGSTGSIVKAIQNILGVGDSSSGTFDKQTTDKVKEFQKLNDLEDDGIVGKKTLEAIYGTRDSAKTHKLLDKTRRGPWSYETIGKEISQVYSKPAGATGTESAKKEKDPLSSWKENENAWKKIKSGYGDLGTNTEDLEDGIKMINSIESLRFIDSIFSKGIPYKPKDISGKEEDTIKYNKSRSAVPDGYSSLSNMLDNELGLGNAETAKNIKKHLETIPGVKVEYKLVPGSSDVDYIKISY
jgi:peptidoglycan hydrolase-like protein with peptidoglycan-binding domain